MLELVRTEELGRLVKLALEHRALQRPYRHVGNGAVIAREKAVCCQMVIQHTKLTADFHDVAIDRVCQLTGALA